MLQPGELHCYDYATLPYEEARTILQSGGSGVFQRATLTAVERAEVLSKSLPTRLGPIEVGAKVKIRIVRMTEEISAVGERSTRLELAWTASKSPALFPSMEATLVAHPLSSGETHLELRGSYRPPRGPIAAVDMAVGQRIAEASVARFMQDVVQHLNDGHAGRA